MILVLNCGSQSIKWKLFDNLKIIKEGERGVFRNYEKILKEELDKLKRFDVNIVGHRVVHGGNKFRDPIKINKGVLREIEKFNNLAPLHNPFNILGIKKAIKFFPGALQIAVFDTGFYKDLPLKAIIYPLPSEYGFVKYGFHGISHEYAFKKASKGRRLNAVSCHLGGGSSITVIKKGKAVDTSMGYTPLEGVVMMTRSGSIDPGIILELSKKFSLKKAEDILNFNSGVKGICGESEMINVLKRKDKKSKLALDIFVYSIQKQIGAYLAVLGRCDMIIFTGTIGFRSAKIRNMICKVFKNIKVAAIEPDEELAIAEKINEEKNPYSNR